jgi:hypothetical protein
MAEGQYKDPLDEILRRVRRIETRQMKLAEAQGVNPNDVRDKVMLGGTPGTLDITGLDVSLGDMLDFCRKSGITERVWVYHQGRKTAIFQMVVA